MSKRYEIRERNLIRAKIYNITSEYNVRTDLMCVITSYRDNNELHFRIFFKIKYKHNLETFNKYNCWYAGPLELIFTR